MTESPRGKVYLVGAGPGDPGLITVRGAEVLSRADVVVNDRLANPRLLRYARPDAELVYAGKSARDHRLSQEEIIELILSRAIAGKIVARLKGGDPFVFGRGGEEALALAQAGVDFEIVPGVTSAVAAPAYAGIPVTHRGKAASLGVITGHEAHDKDGSDIRWDRIATGLDTIVFLMGVESLPHIVDNLVANGRADDTPAAVVQWGTHPSQRTVTGTLADIAARCESAGLTAPAVTVVGDVVSLRESIRWFDRRPLFGCRIIVTRAEGQASALTGPLEELGARVDEFPVIKFSPPPDTGPMDDAISCLGSFDWIIFTSANGVEWFVLRLEQLGMDLRAMGGAKLAAIGPKTARALRDLRLRVDYVPSEYVAEAVVDQFPTNVSGRKVLIPRALEARAELPEGLRAMGAEVVVAPVYQTVMDDSRSDELRERLTDASVDVITFTSASTVRFFFEQIGDTVIPPRAMIACIGPVTADAARAKGLSPAVVAEEYTIEGLVRALADALDPRNGASGI